MWFKAMNVLPGPRRHAAPVPHVAPPYLNKYPTNVLAALAGNGPNPAVPMPGNMARPVLGYLGPIPKVLQPLPVPYIAMTRFYVYHPTASMIGPFPVKTEGGVRVVYMTEAQAFAYFNSNLIGRTPWALVSYGSRKLIYQFSGGAIVADLPPVVNIPLVNQTGSVSVALTPYVFNVNSFWDPDNHSATLTYTASLSSGAALPAWLSFNPSTRTFSGTPPGGSAGTYTVRVTATDPWGRSVSDDFTYTIS